MEADVRITLPDGKTVSTPRGTRVLDFVKNAIGPGLAKAALVAKLDGIAVDMSKPLDQDASLEILTPKSAGALPFARHDAAHIVADAVQRLFPGTQVTIGPAIEEGFYYDFYREHDGKPAPFSPEELLSIEAQANAIVQADLPFVRREVTADEAIRLFDEMGEAFKVEIINDIVARGAQTLSLYSHGDWVDFCLGPHGPSTGRVGVIKLMSSSGAYWRGDSQKAQLQRIYGTSFFDKGALAAFLKQREEALKRDHRRVGRELNLFHFHPSSPGAAFWTPKGTQLYLELSQAMRAWASEAGYVEIKTPLLFNKSLWETSGHWGKYQENMFLVLDSESGEQTMSLKPMNCPSHHLYFSFEKRSHRDLPLRIATQDVLHRNEATGTLGGLTRVRQFAQDDGHIYCRPDQLQSEAVAFVALLDRVYRAFGMTYEVSLSTRPPERIGDDATWDRAESDLKEALDFAGLAYTLAEGSGAFYGPKLDFNVQDSMGRSWQLGTFQLDYNAPERFDLTYVGEDNRPHRPIVLHRAIYGSFERFIAILIEHYAGAFPVWLAPLQVAIITVADRQQPYAQEVAGELRKHGLRVWVDERGFTMQKKIAEAQTQKIPYALIVGDREVEERKVAPRKYAGDALSPCTIEAFLEGVVREALRP